MDFYELLHLKLDTRGATPYERNFKQMQHEFYKYFEDSLTKAKVLVNGKNYIEVTIVDHSQSNNKDLSDDKYVHAPNETKISVGDYILWDNQYWMVFSKENKTIATHQQAKIKESNQSIKWIRNGKIVNNELGWWSYVQSNTLYTMGVSENTLIDVVDSKMMMYMQNNADTRDLQINERIFIGSRVYKIKFPDKVSRFGLISFLLDEDTINENYDNVELGVADYYRFYGTDTDVREELEEGHPDHELSIVGNKNPKIGSINSYEANFEVEEWTIDTVESEDLVVVMSSDANKITIEVVQDRKFANVGKSFTITARDSSDNYTSLHLTVRTKY